MADQLDVVQRELSVGIRRVLGLTQEQWGHLLGLGGKTVARLESRKEQPDLTWTASMSRLLWLIGQTPMERLEAVLDGLSGPFEEKAPADLRASLREAVQRALVEKAADLTLEELVTGRDRTRRWVYWATGALASLTETKALADDEGIICRPLFHARDAREPSPNASRPDYAYLELLAPGDEVLLCHNAEPCAWYALQRAGAKAQGVPQLERVKPVITSVALDSELGRRLARSGYRLWDGRPAQEGKAGWFSCLKVRPKDVKLLQPAPRKPGNRDTVTPFEAASGR